MNDTPSKEAPEVSPTTAHRPEPMRARIAVAVQICCARPTLRRTTRIAVVVGLVLTGINEGDSLAHGQVSAATGVKMALNFVVPFVVSNLGVLAGTRRG
jgi:hypothetical protein